MAERVLAADSLGLRPIGYFDADVPVGTTLSLKEGSPALDVEGNLAALIKFARDGGVDYVFVALPLADGERVMARIHALFDTTAVLRAGFLRVLEGRHSEAAGRRISSG